VLNWTPREHEDHIFGSLKGKSRWLTPELLDTLDEHLKEGWIGTDEEKGGPNGEKFLESFVENEKAGWTAQQVWGFAIVEGERRYTRRVVVTKGETVLKIRMVYNWYSA
jgi:hypothetical protein